MAIRSAPVDSLGSRFYLKYVLPHKSEIERGSAGYNFRRFRRKGWRERREAMTANKTATFMGTGPTTPIVN